MTHRRRGKRVYTKTVSSTISEETWERLQAHAPWSKFIREAIEEKLDGRIAELETYADTVGAHSARQALQIAELEQTMRECADELENALKESTHFLDIGLDVTEKLIAKLRGQSQ